MRRLAVRCVPAPADLEPLASASLRQRLPHLTVAMDSEQMRTLLQAALLDGTGYVAKECALPKADVTDGVCRLQYQLAVRTPGGDLEELVVLGTMFPDRGSARRFARAALAPRAIGWSSRGLPAFKPTGIVGGLDMAVSVFPLCASLPTLMDVTDHRRMISVFDSVLATDEAAELVAIELIRLRRTPRCVLRYRFGPGGQKVMYGKVGSTAGDDHVRRGLDAIAGRVLPTGDGSVLFPRMLDRRPELDLALFDGVPGSRPDIGVAAMLDAVIDGAALAAVSMHTSGVDVGTVHTLDSQLARAREAVRLIDGDAPDLARWLIAVAECLAPMIRGAPASTTTFAHGDFTLSQLVLGESHVGVLDFDGLCQAEPSFDLGRFVAYLRLALAKSGNPDADALTARFLATYDDLGGPPTSEIRVRLYAIVSLMLMAVRSWQQLKPRRLQLVCGVLEQQVSELARGTLDREETR